MEDDWVGKAVSIHCDAKLGIFQGIIKELSESQITIVRAFRNGVPLRKQDAEVTLRATDILNISLIPVYNGLSTVMPTVINKPTPVKQPNFANAGNGAAGGSAIVSGAGACGYSESPPTLLHDSPHESSSTLTSQISSMHITPPGGEQQQQQLRRATPTDPFPRAPNAPQPQFLPLNGFPQPPQSSSATSRSPPCTSSVAQFFGNLIPPKVEVRMGAALNSCSSTSVSTANSCTAESFGSSCSSRPIDIVRSHSVNGSGNGKARNGNGGTSLNGGNGNGNGNTGANKKQRKQQRLQHNINQTFGSSMEDPLLLHDEFDFEGNLALFDKKALWHVLESSEQKPDLVRHASMPKTTKKYRHDENILVSEPTQLRQIETMFADGSTDFVTDEGLIIPTIPTFVRSKIELTAEKAGLSLQRQTDILARGASDLAILLLGGARRLTPNNCHQWPTIAIICDKSEHFRVSNTGAATGRQLASHGLKVFLYMEEEASIEQNNIEISLFKATGNTVVYSVNALPTPDLVILSTNSSNLSGDVKKWLSENRASILAIDPPTQGIPDVSIKYAILPILPLNGISTNNCGKLYLCNLGIPDKFYRDAGIKYKSPFGHKFVIPIHSKD